MAATTMLHVRVDETIKTQATQALASMGLTVSDAVRMLLTRVAADQAFPLELKVPNAQTREAMAEVDEMIRSGAPRFTDANEFFKSLDDAAAQARR
jgi:DNA-damage-inducible protein J